MSKRYLTESEQKKIMLDMLKYVDKTCRDNDIKYSLIGGSLIGAIRHHGYIPWDDDIDIILTDDNYYRLKTILDKERYIYQTLKFCKKNSDSLGFMKLVDTRTQATEKKCVYNPNYGVFIDIFCYYPTSDNKRKRIKQYKKIEFLLKIATILRISIYSNGTSLSMRLKTWAEKCFARIIGYRGIDRVFKKMANDKNNTGTKYVISSWPIYGMEKEIQLRKNTEKYIDVKFEDMNAMVFEKYDEILKNIYGNYMDLPPESERVAKHNMRIWWKDEYTQDEK